MSYIDEMKAYYSGEKPVRKKIVKRTMPTQRPQIIYVQSPMQPMYSQSRPIKRQVARKSSGKSYATMLREAQAKDRYNAYVKQKRQEQLSRIKSGIGSGVSGVKSTGAGITGFVKSKASAIKRIGAKGLFKKSIYD